VTALAEYELSKGYGQSSVRIREITGALRRVDARLAELRAASDETPRGPLQFEAAHALPLADDPPVDAEEWSQ
jgi:hypothetical protein